MNQNPAKHETEMSNSKQPESRAASPTFASGGESDSMQPGRQTTGGSVPVGPGDIPPVNLPGSTPPAPVFLRMPSGPQRQLWPGANLSYWDLRRLVSAGPWNNNKPPVRAYDLRKPGAKRGIPLIEHADLIAWLDGQFQRTNAGCAPLPLPNIQLPPVLSIPASGEQCPFTQLRHTTLYELSLPHSPYGQTRIYVTRYLLPGSATSPIVLETQSLLRFIRSFPPPRYQIAPPAFSAPIEE
jgi:hypothetical protein